MSGITFGITPKPTISPAEPVDAKPADLPGFSNRFAQTQIDPHVRRRAGRIQNITKRGNIWYFKKTIGGKRKFLSLNTTDKDEAKKRAKMVAKKIAGEKWADIDLLQSKRMVATVAEVLAVYKASAAARGLGTRTYQCYCAQVWNILRKGLGRDPGKMASTDLLTEGLVMDYQAAVLAAAGPDKLAKERAQRTIRSTVTNARAVFSPWTKRAYDGLKLPDLSGFLNTPLNRTLVRTYRMPAAYLVERTLREGRELRVKNPKLYAVFLLCYDLGLRAGEASVVRWDWFSTRGTQRVIEILRRSEFTPKWNKERRVPVSDEVWAHLQELRNEREAGFILPGEMPYERLWFVTREFSAWMRSIGWDRRDYPKAAHELRKLMGSRWYTECGAEVAQELLGHQNVATTCASYAALRQQPKPLKMDF